MIILKRKLIGEVKDGNFKTKYYFVIGVETRKIEVWLEVIREPEYAYYGEPTTVESELLYTLDIQKGIEGYWDGTKNSPVGVLMKDWIENINRDLGDVIIKLVQEEE